jgi:cell division GTPase FtsZ
MQADEFRGYALWGHAIEEGKVRSTARFAASGTITRDRKFVEASGVLGLFDAAQDAEEAGLEWARAWIESHE